MKFFKTALITSLILSIFIPTSIIADDQEENWQETDSASGVYETYQKDVILVAAKGVSYKVTLPKSGQGGEEDVDYEIAVTQSTGGELEVNIYKNGQKVETENDDESVSIDISNERANFYHNDLENDYVPDGNGSSTVTIEHDDLDDGIWVGRMPIKISLSERKNIGEQL